MLKKIQILFSPEMVRAILGRRKNMTRRTRGLKRINTDPDDWMQPVFNESVGEWVFTNKGTDGIQFWIKCPYGVPGDILWVREKFRKFVDFEDGNDIQIEYAADNPPMRYLHDEDGFQIFNKNGSERMVPWKSSMYMPYAACRLFLRVKSIRVERLHEISEKDVLAEGFACMSKDDDRMYKYGLPGSDGLPGGNGWPWGLWCGIARNAFKKLWVAINGVESWYANPWIWIIEYEPISKKEVNAMQGAGLFDESK